MIFYKKWSKRIIAIFSPGFLFFLLVPGFPALAALPQPPSSDIASSSSDWIDVGSAMITRGIQYTCILLGAILLMGVAGTILKAFHTAQEKQDLGHFFKILIVGIIAAAIGIGLLYAGYQTAAQQG